MLHKPPAQNHQETQKDKKSSKISLFLLAKELGKGWPNRIENLLQYLPYCRQARVENHTCLQPVGFTGTTLGAIFYPPPQPLIHLLGYCHGGSNREMNLPWSSGSNETMRESKGVLVGTLFPYNDDHTLVSEGPMGIWVPPLPSTTVQCEPALHVLPSPVAGGPVRNWPYLEE